MRLDNILAGLSNHARYKSVHKDELLELRYSFVTKMINLHLQIWFFLNSNIHQGERAHI